MYREITYYVVLDHILISKQSTIYGYIMSLSLHRKIIKVWQIELYYCTTTERLLLVVMQIILGSQCFWHMGTKIYIQKCGIELLYSWQQWESVPQQWVMKKPRRPRRCVKGFCIIFWWLHGWNIYTRNRSVYETEVIQARQDGRKVDGFMANSKLG